MAKADRTAAESGFQQAAERMGFELVDVSVDREPAGRFLRIYIDKPEGITLDDCEAYHRAVLPLAENIEYDYMEVSSPGIDRPLKTDRDFERGLGSEIEVKLFRPLDGVKTLNGVLTDFSREDLVIKTAGGEKRIPRKAAALVKPVVDMEGIEEVDLGE